jgi:hypothetical protein
VLDSDTEVRIFEMDNPAGLKPQNYSDIPLPAVM